jgi:hypothetical protein
MGVYSEFKRVYVGGPFQRTLNGALTTTVPWSDPTGGAIRQEFVVGSEKWTRASTGPDGAQTGSQHTWTAWQDDSPTPSSVLNTVNDLKNNALRKDAAFRVTAPANPGKWLEVGGDGWQTFPGGWGDLRFSDVRNNTFA